MSLSSRAEFVELMKIVFAFSVFLSNFWMKMIRPAHEQPGNVVQFECSMEMTKYDVKNYLEKIYKLPVIEVRTRIDMGKTRRDMGAGYVVKDEDAKIAYVTLVSGLRIALLSCNVRISFMFQPKDVQFKFPDLFPETAEKRREDDRKSLDDAKKGFKEFLDRNKNRPGTPGWYSI
jgi:large subunit ribosomal protein L23